MSAAIYSNAFQTNFIMEANTINPKEQPELGPYCLKYRSPKYISRRERSDDNCCEYSSEKVLKSNSDCVQQTINFAILGVKILHYFCKSLYLM